MSSPTELYLPPDFPYPIKIVTLDVKPNDRVSRGTRLLSYSFLFTPSRPDAKPETRFGTWDSPNEGHVEAWHVRQAEIISSRRAKDKPVMLVKEPCKHGVQIGGLCGLCGKDMTDFDYTGYSDASRASIQMTHSAFGPTVSLEEAQRIERETAEHLLKSRKLSLIVDLDQTIVHATVDPTVGEWISEGEVWEARQMKKADASNKNEGDDSDDSTSSDSDDECNPNWEALKDVKKFRLGPEAFGLPTGLNKGKQRLLDNNGCMYYVKPRPGWKTFLEGTAKKYEMHVYTMGTRAYAEEVCSLIDPDGKLFGGRILSRDESGSLTQKSLQRLFPCDTSMVVIIDDRADVWEWSPNLIKVIPYDFFVGIGDINSAFLPKIEQHPHTFIPPAFIGKPPLTPPTSPSDVSPRTPLQPDNPTEAEAADRVANDMLTQNSLALEAQVSQRPLAKKQEELEEAEAKLSEMTPDEAHSAGAKEAPQIEPPNPKPPKPVHKALLKNDDVELDRVSKLLAEVHKRFFTAYDSRSPDTETKKLKGGLPSRRREPVTDCDVTRIIPRMRLGTLDGVIILFSSVIPLDTKPDTTEIWRTANMFGAVCQTELNHAVTHVVAAKRGTVKVDAARKRGGIKVVWLSWFYDSINLWKRQDETPYLLDDPATVTVGPNSSPTAESHQISSDPEPDTDDWDEMDDSGFGSDTNKPFAISQINWADINDEVEAAMNESDDDDEGDADRRSEVDGAEDDPSRSGNIKRKRSGTPSESGVSSRTEDDSLRSPLAKRRKQAAERSGYSKLKEAITADDLESAEKDKIPTKSQAPTEPVDEGEMEEGGEGDDEEESSQGEMDDDDDFLARELQDELG